MAGIFLIVQLQLLLVVSCCHGLTVTSATETTITLSWPRGNYKNFTIKYSGEDGLNYTKHVLDLPDDTITTTIDDHLEAGQLYTIDIRGHTLSGDSISVVSAFTQATMPRWALILFDIDGCTLVTRTSFLEPSSNIHKSSVVHFRHSKGNLKAEILALAEPNPPTNLTVTSATTDSLTLVWLEENDAMTTYVVRYEDLTNDSSSLMEYLANDTGMSLTHLQPGHTYSITVVARYYGVESNQTTPITDNTVPLPPEKVSARAINGSTLYVQWQPDMSSIQEMFIVSYQKDEGIAITVTCVNYSDTDCTILTTDELPGQLYKIMVKAAQGHRSSSPVITFANTKPLAAQELKPLNITSQSIQVSWLMNAGSKHTGFLVTLVPVDSSHSLQNKTDVGAVFDGLMPGKTYQVTVVTLAGEEKSDPLMDVFWTVPVSPVVRSESSNDTIVLRWDSPAGHRDNFSIVATDLMNSSDSNPQVVAGTALSGEISNLRPGSSYMITVTAQSGNQKSKPTVLPSVTTVPNVVEDLRVFDTDLHSVLVVWKPPTFSVIEEYKVTVMEIPESTQYVDAHQDELWFSGLLAGTQYTVSVRSVSGNRSKESPASSLIITTLPASVESLEVTTDTRSIHVHWSLPAGTTYEFLNISLSNLSGVLDTVSRHKSSPNAWNQTFFNLESGSLYIVTIVTSLSNGIVGRSINETAITEPVPVKVISFPGLPKSYSLAFTWTVYPAEAHGYLVTVIDLSNASIPRYEDIVPGKEANVTGLYPGHYYEVSVRAFVNYTGTIVYSDSVAENTTTKPLPVAKLTWTSSPVDILVSWQASIETQSRHDAFEFKYRSVLRDPKSNWTNFVKTEAEATIKDVFPGERYDVEVRTVAGHITSDAQNSSVIIAPKAPQSVLVIEEMTTTDSLYIDLQEDENQSYATHWNVTLTPSSPATHIVVKSIPRPLPNLTQIAGLRSGETYTIDVYSVTVGETKSDSSVATSGTVRPVLDTELTEAAATNSTLTVAYTQNSPVFDNYYFQLDTDKPVLRSMSEGREVHFQELIAGQLTFIKVWVNSSGVTSEQKTYHFQIYPNMVQTEFVVQATEISILLIKPEGLVDYYNITCYHGPNRCGFYHLNASENQQEVNFTDLTAYQDYGFTILTASGQKHVARNFSKQTAQSAPSVVRKVSASVLAPNTVQVRWERPKLANGDITKYQIRYVGKLQGKPDDEKTRWLTGWEVPPTNITLPNLLAGYTYTFYVSAYTVTSGPSGDTTLTVAAYPPPFKDSLKTEDLLPTTVAAPSPTSAKLKFVNAFSEKGGEILAYTIIVSTDNSTEQKMPIVLPGWHTAQNDPAIKAYQAIANCTQFFSHRGDCHTPTARKRRNTNTQSESMVFTIGTEKGCEEKVYCNGPLKPDTEYYVALRAFTAGGPNDTPYSKKIRTASIPSESDPGPVIGGVVAGVLVIAILVLIVVLYRIRQRRPNMYKKEDHELRDELHIKRNSSRRTKTSRIVKLTEFPDHFMLMSADSDYRFAEEFEELRDVGRDQSCIAAELPQNRAKNRFTNILPYDHSRVKLLPTDDEEGSDYINANYMPGYNSRREYIVTQGPLHSTRDDFWRLLWEQNTRNIIMLTRCVEKGREKCDHYWPQNSENMFYGDLQVAVLNETKFPDWTITEFRVSLGDNSRKVRHFHYTAWPDFGVPERPVSLVKFVTTVREKMMPEGGPHIVHCSAGVGRSGTYIALDRLLQHIQHNDWVDPYGIVYEMRSQRVWMVQTEQQYICIHQCLLSVLQGCEEDPVYCNQAHDNVGFEDKKDTLPLCPPEVEDDEGINVEIM